ncbi:hypothetical protein SAMN04487819_102353 [Actinopolyspora alba]|uniref:Uncharacterized protein n=1 Tax=Actinopolyspora alba TaxID=673379 RepID=A0A1I1UQ03_9ACTN|nr:hypothetical protein [Actinopolyspora alba]SFD72891.1 hypothetical protein SAMN04487819_102353 [Actinopolyspora alba]
MSWWWFRWREGVAAESERLAHAVDVAVGRDYLISPCGGSSPAATPSGSPIHGTPHAARRVSPARRA